MAKTSREFQVFVKPAGPICNMSCSYCYYLPKENLYKDSLCLMSDALLEEYIVQHIEATEGPEIRFSWHGGEPTILGLDFFKKVVEIQKRYRPDNSSIINGIQTNGILLDERWCSFFAEEGFGVGLSLDGPGPLHDAYRLDKRHKPTFEKAIYGYRLLQRYRVPTDILCVIHKENVRYPLEVYKFFKEIGASFIGFLPLIEYFPGQSGVSRRSITPDDFGRFLSVIFDEWIKHDIGHIKIQIFEEAIGTAMGKEHGLCIFRETCGDIPVIEHNGDFFPCDHYVNKKYLIGNILETPLVELLESKRQRDFGSAKKNSLPLYCKECDFLSLCNGGCPKDRFLKTPDGELGLNYLCEGYKGFFTHIKPFLDEISAQTR